MIDGTGSVSLDLNTLARRYQAGGLAPQALVDTLIARLEAEADPAIWITRLPAERLRTQACDVERRRATGAALPLYGVPFAVKDNIDVAGVLTTAGCPAFAHVPDRTAAVVSRLLEAGAILVGKTNLDQFASGLAGDRTPYGTCRNVFDDAYIAGGSSSGSAAAVARGLVSFALGTDTAGSGRVPAGCSNLVGLKPTPAVLSNDGVVPACPSLDCISVLALTAADAARVTDIAAGRAVAPVPEGTANDALGPGWTFAVPRDEDLEFFGDGEQERLYRQALGRLEAMGGRRQVIDFRPLRDVALLLYEGPWLAERLAAHERFLKQHADAVHPVTRAVLQGGARYGAADVFKGWARLEVLRGKCAGVFDEADVLVVPTMPTVPRRADVEADSLLWSRRLGHYTNFVNLLRWAALAVPAGFTPRGLPGGITLIGPAHSDRQLCRLGLAWQRQTDLPLGATGHRLPAAERPGGGGSPSPPPGGFCRVAVAGAHLRGQPLHPALRRCGARFVRACRTAPRYRFVALLDLDPPRPGLVRDTGRNGAVAVEIYDLPADGFGRLVASVAPPLAIGTVELEDGEAVKGFLCESYAAATATDITDFGGWVAFRKRAGG